jgi:hypothetical protein
MGSALGLETARFRKTNTISGCANDGAFAKADCQRLIAESLPMCFGCGYAALCLETDGVLCFRAPTKLILGSGGRKSLVDESERTLKLFGKPNCDKKGNLTKVLGARKAES